MYSDEILIKQAEEEAGDSFHREDLDAALIFAFETLGDAQLEFFVMGKTAQSMYEEKFLSGKKIELGVMAREVTDATRDMLKMVNPTIDIQDKKIIMEHNGVPIEVKIIKLHYRALDNMDFIQYAYETFLIPNPFDAFIRMSKFLH